MKYRINHQTVYAYAEEVAESHHLARMHCRDDESQTCTGSRLTVSPRPSVMRRHHDAFANEVTFFALEHPHDELTVVAESEVETRPVDDRITKDPQPWDTVSQQLAEDNSGTMLEAHAFRTASPHVPLTPELAAFARRSFRPGRPLVEAAVELNSRIFTEFTFDPAATTIATPVGEVLRDKRGVCQDFAHLAIACLRSLGLSARYVSGYLETLPPPGKARLVGADASHAWIMVYVPGSGWLELDPTNNCIPGTRHIRVACGRDFSDVSPLRGVIHGGGEATLSVMVDVVPLA